ncbi:Uncharacterised protein [uncultured archaeon]|nr:Uncharacterised protein [uncultured archaeon]
MYAGMVRLTDVPLVERYEFGTFFGQDSKYRKFVDLLFCGDVVRIDRYVLGEVDGKAYLLPEGSGCCQFDLNDDALLILGVISPNIGEEEQSGTFALKRLEEIAKEKGLKRIDVVDGKNYEYWGNKLGFHKTTSTRKYNDGGRWKTIDFVKPITKKAELKYPPISTRHEFRRVSRKPLEAEGPSYDLELFNITLIKLLAPQA